MALIIDPDLIRDGTELVIDTTLKTIQLVKTGNLSDDGVTLKALYSKLKELWQKQTPGTYRKFPFPMQPITDEQMEFINTWNLKDATTRNLIRTGGWAVKSPSGVSYEEYAGVISLGSIASTDQVYFQQEIAGAATNFVLTGPVNQAVKVYGDVSNGNFDYRDYLKLFCRVQGKTFSSAQLSDIGVVIMSYQVFRFPISNATDLKITHSDIQIDANSDGTPDVAPYDAMAITWDATGFSVVVDGTARDFHVLINANNATLEQVYEFVQFELRQNLDIDQGAGDQTGKITNELLQFIGDTLKCKMDENGGVFIENIQVIDKNRVVFIDDLGAERQYPYTAILTLKFGDNLVADASSIYTVYFTNDAAGDNSGYNFGTANAIVVKDATTVDMDGEIGGNSEIQFTYDYDANVQRGAASAGTVAPITVVAIGFATAQYIKATGSIARSIANTVTLTAPLERNYINP